MTERVGKTRRHAVKPRRSTHRHFVGAEFGPHGAVHFKSGNSGHNPRAFRAWTRLGGPTFEMAPYESVIGVRGVLEYRDTPLSERTLCVWFTESRLRLPSRCLRPRSVRDAGHGQGVADGGIKVAGWTGKVDANEAKAGPDRQQWKSSLPGKGFHVTTVPAITYWNPANKAAGDYTVKATFKEPKFMNLNEHAHPTASSSASMTSAGEHEHALLRRVWQRHVHRSWFGPAPFSVSPRRAEANAAINKAAGKEPPVHAGNCAVGEGRQGRVPSERHRRRQL